MNAPISAMPQSIEQGRPACSALRFYLNGFRNSACLHTRIRTGNILTFSRMFVIPSCPPPLADLSADGPESQARQSAFRFNMPGNPVRTLVLLIAAGLSVSFSACGKKYVPAPVDTGHARETLAYALECLKEGLPP